MSTHASSTVKALPFEVGAPSAYAGLTVIPLFPTAEPDVEYIGLDEAASRGFVVTEVGDGDVRGLCAENPLDEDVLLYEGEELVGAKQNRVVRHTALVGALSSVTIPVDCVERGRWAWRTARFDASDRVAYPEQRRLRHKGAGQAEVWENVHDKAGRHGAFSPTEAQEEIYRVRGSSMEEYLKALPRQNRQCGVLVGIAGRVVCLDYVSRPDVFASLYAKLLRGYALDAIERPLERRLRGVDEFLADIAAAPRKLRPAVALGSESRFAGRTLGVDLNLDGELVALTAFPA